jgi:hypothetical protein
MQEFAATKHQLSAESLYSASEREQQDGREDEGREVSADAAVLSDQKTKIGLVNCHIVAHVPGD